jgi:hypothetical protein
LAEARNNLGDAVLDGATNANGRALDFLAPEPTLVGLIELDAPHDQSRT